MTIAHSSDLESNLCRQGPRLHVTDVDSWFLGGTTGDADAHSLGAHKAEEDLLLLNLLPSNGRQARNAALLLLRCIKQNKTVELFIEI